MSERADEMIRLLGMADDYTDPNPGRDHITGLDHACRVAGLLELRQAHHSQLPFAGLIHDLARPLNDVHHREMVAEMVKDRVDPTIYWILRTHGEYQDALIHGHPWPHTEADTKLALLFAACEAMSFDPGVHDTDLPHWGYARARDTIHQYLD
jgi:hypothetical protein